MSTITCSSRAAGILGDHLDIVQRFPQLHPAASQLALSGDVVTWYRYRVRALDTDHPILGDWVIERMSKKGKKVKGVIATFTWPSDALRALAKMAGDQS